MEARGIYLYCLKRPGAAKELRSAAEDGLTVNTLEVRDVAAVFRHVPLDEFQGESAEARFREPSWVIQRAINHERIVEEAMETSPVLPVRFGSVFSSVRALAEYLERGHDTISEFLSYVADKEEWAVTGRVNIRHVEGWLLASDPALQELKGSIPKSPGARYIYQKRLDLLLAAKRKVWCSAVAGEALEELKTCAADSHALGLPASEASTEGRMTMFRGAFLVPREHLGEFRRRVGDVVEKHRAEDLSLETTGAWPPYNFCPSIEHT